MGHDKNFVSLPFGDGRGLLQWAADRIAEVCVEWLVADGGRELLPGARSVTDGPGAGPAAGLLGAFEHARGRRLLALACDLPLVPSAFLRFLSRQSGDWVVPATEQGLEPMCAVYGPRAIERLRQRALEGKRSLKGLAESHPRLDVRRIYGRDWLDDWVATTDSGSLGGSDVVFSNLNRPQDLDLVRECFANAALRQGNFLRLDSTRG